MGGEGYYVYFCTVWINFLIKQIRERKKKKTSKQLHTF